MSADRCGLVRRPLQFALTGDPLMSLEIALDAVGRLAAFRGSMANNPVFSRWCVGDSGRAAKVDRLADSEFVFVHAGPHASRLLDRQAFPPSNGGDAPKSGLVPGFFRRSTLIKAESMIPPARHRKNLPFSGSALRAEPQGLACCYRLRRTARDRQNTTSPC